jgi:surface antigen
MQFTSIILGLAATLAAASPIDINPRGDNSLLLVDDYPYKNQCNIVDRWGCLSCQCTSFVAWRLEERDNFLFDPTYGNVIWGDAYTWDEAALLAGLTVDDNATVGSVAQKDGVVGHVAWVAAVDGDSVTIEEYNFGGETTYHTRVVERSAYRYIHFESS